MYESIRNDLKTGDIVLFSGNGAFSKIIKLFSASKWSHVGIVVRSSELDLVLLWESTTLSGVKDAIDGTMKKGVQTVSLSSRIDKYDGDVSYRSLSFSPTTEMIGSLKDLRRKYKDLPYEKDLWELANSLIDFKFVPENEEDFSSIFCSELVAEALESMGILTGRLPANEYTPRDFGNNGRFEHYLTPGISYGEEIILKTK